MTGQFAQRILVSSVETQRPDRSFAQRYDACRVATWENPPICHQERDTGISRLAGEPAVADRVTERGAVNRDRVNPADAKEAARTIKSIPEPIECNRVVERRRADVSLRSQGERCEFRRDGDV